MKPPSRNAVPGDIAAITEARLTFGQRGRALDTGAALRFALDHARAREAVMAELDMARIAGHLAEAGLEHRSVTSAAATRDAYIRRPDLGRTLPGAEAERLAGAGPVDVAIVLGDGLSGIAANLAGPAFVTALAHAPVGGGPEAMAPSSSPRRPASHWAIPSPWRSGRRRWSWRLANVRGLSAADSLGVYITRAPRIGTPDSARNCLSNIREGGMDVETAADRAMALIRTMRRIGTSGVALSQHIAGAGLPER